MKYYIAADHAGIEIKAFVKDLFEQRGHEVIDLGHIQKIELIIQILQLKFVTKF